MATDVAEPLTSAEKDQARQLEADLFGGADALVDNVASGAHASGAAETLHDAEPVSIAAYVLDAPSESDAEVHDVATTSVPDGERSKASKRKRKPAWDDAEDTVAEVDVAAVPRLTKLRQHKGESVLNGAVYEQRLRGQHRKLHPNVDWATRERREAEPGGGEESALKAQIRTASDLKTTGVQLPAGRVELTRVRDANIHERSKAVVQGLEFHPNAQLLMTASFDKRLCFYHADGVRNSVVQTVFLEDLPVHTSRFAAGGRLVLASGRRKFFYVLDLESQKLERVKGLHGRDERSLESFVVPPAASAPDQRSCAAFLGNEGVLPLLSLSSRQWVGELRVNGSVRCAAFCPEGRQLYTGGSDGHVYLWDLRMQRCVHKMTDQGCVRGTSLAVGAGLFAAGSDSGVVNVYRRPELNGAAVSAPSPLRPFTNLVTSVDSLAFSPDSQMLCMASRLKRDALRLVHLPSLTTFENWPTGRSPLHYVHKVAFSPGGGLLAIGNAKGHVLMYRLHHYPEI